MYDIIFKLDEELFLFKWKNLSLYVLTIIFSEALYVQNLNSLESYNFPTMQWK